MHYAALKPYDIANGPGIRVSLFVSGCTHHCPGCFNREAWDFHYGTPFTSQTEEQLLQTLAPAYINGLTLLGGEPMEPANQEVLLPFLRRVKAAYPQKTIWCYTGYIYENDLLSCYGKAHCKYTLDILALCDVLVDGPYVSSLRDITLLFRGSSNQRLIDLRKSEKAGNIVLWENSF